MTWVNVGNLKGDTGEKGDTGDTGATGAKGDTGDVNLKTTFMHFTNDFIQVIDPYTEGIPVAHNVSGTLKGVNDYEISSVTDGKVNAYIGNPANGGVYGSYASYSVSKGTFYYNLYEEFHSALLEVYVVFSGSTSYAKVKEKTYVFGHIYTRSASDLNSSYTIYSPESINFYYTKWNNLGDVMAVKLDPDNQLVQGIGVFSSASSGLGFFVNYNYLWAIYNGSKYLIASGIPLGPDTIMIVTKYNNYPRIMFFDTKGNLIFSCDTDIATFPTSGSIGVIETKNTIYF